MQIQTNFEFFNQSKIISGKCALDNIPFELTGYDARKPLVIASRKVTERGLKKTFIKAFYDSVTVIGAFFDEVDDYAGITLAQRGATLFRSRGCDSIIALGGGAAVDVARAVNLLVTGKTDTLQPYLDGAPIPAHLKPMIYVPAGASRGTEAANIMTIDNRRIVSDALYPDVVILDPRMTRSCCAECAAQSAAIAIEQAAMSILDEKNNPMIDAYAYPAMRYLAENIKKGIKKPGNRDAALALANASVMAAVASANAGPGIARLLAEELETLTGVSTGTLIGILLPHALSRVANKKSSLRDELLLAAAGMEVYSATPQKERAIKGVEVTLAIYGNLKRALPAGLQQLNIQKHLLARAADAAAKRSGKRYTEADCLAVLDHAW